MGRGTKPMREIIPSILNMFNWSGLYNVQVTMPHRQRFTTSGSLGIGEGWRNRCGPHSMDEISEYKESDGTMRNSIVEGWTKDWEPEKSEKQLENQMGWITNAKQRRIEFQSGGSTVEKVRDKPFITFGKNMVICEFIESIFSGNQNAGGGGMMRKPADGCKCRLSFHIIAVKGESNKGKVRVLLDRFL